MATDDQGAVPRYRRPTREMATPQPAATDFDAHAWRCLGSPDGPGARRFDEVKQELVNVKQDAVLADKERRAEIVSIRLRLAGWGAVIAFLVFAIPIALGVWIKWRTEAMEASAIKRSDIEAALQRHAETQSAKRLDDAGLIKMMVDKALVLPPDSTPMQKARR